MKMLHRPMVKFRITVLVVFVYHSNWVTLLDLGRELVLLLPILIMLLVFKWRTLFCQTSWCINSSSAFVIIRFQKPVTSRGSLLKLLNTEMS